jgi:hypothetical protein
MEKYDVFRSKSVFSKINDSNFLFKKYVQIYYLIMLIRYYSFYYFFSNFSNYIIIYLNSK